VRLLLVEDGLDLAQIIMGELHPAGFAVDHVDNLEDASFSARATDYAAVLLDRQLPDGDGLTWLKSMRRQNWTLPAIIMSGSCYGVRDKIEGLNAGADDYLVKPMEFGELVARIRAVLRRPQVFEGTCLKAGNIILDVVGRECRTDHGDLVAFTRREFCIFEQMMRRFNRVVPKASLENALYGQDDEVSANSIEVGVHRVRKRLADAGASLNVQTVRGIGYMLNQTRSLDVEPTAASSSALFLTRVLPAIAEEVSNRVTE
jgi:DNA-binding response OmpR family regulator